MTKTQLYQKALINIFLTLNRITTVRYRVDKIFGALACLQIRHHSDEWSQELLVKGGESVIVAENGSIKYAKTTKIIPIDCEGQNLDKK